MEMRPMQGVRFTFIMVLLAISVAGCRRSQQVKDYDRPLPPGAYALRKLTNPADYPDLQPAWRSADVSLGNALLRSLTWFEKPSTKAYFPVAGIGHEHARASLARFRELLLTAQSSEEFEQRVYEEFDVYSSIGWDGSGTVLYTGYFSPVFRASLTQNDEYRYPLYKRPDDLVTDEMTGKTLGRQVGSTVISYPTRAMIESTGMLRGTELVWLKSKLDAYIIQVNGSAKLIMTDGRPMYIGYAGNNGHEYSSIGRMMKRDGKIPSTGGIPTIRGYFRDHPAELDYYVNKNDRFVFFKEYGSDLWPAGSLGFKVEPWRSLATDKDVFPRACMTLVTTQVPTSSGAKRPFSQFMLDQDTGGAIRAAGRGDIYMGIGEQAEHMAGRQAEEGRLYYFFLKNVPVQ